MSHRQSDGSQTEAMAAGLPVIATDMGGNSDIVNPEAGCGLLVEYDNPDSMAGALKGMLEEPAEIGRRYFL